MAIIKCPECKREISDQADKCPHCGYPLRNKFETNKPMNSVLGIVLGAIFFIASFVLFLLYALLQNLTISTKRLLLILGIVTLVCSIFEFLLASVQSKKKN